MNRGCKAIYASCSATATVLRDGMTRAPVVRFVTAARAAELKVLLEDPGNFETLLFSTGENLKIIPTTFSSKIVEICREYRLQYSTPLGHNLTGIRKAVVSPDCVWTDLDELEVHSVGEDGQLGYSKYGDENWTYLDDQHGCSYDDIIVYEGKVCVVDWSGTVPLIYSSFRTQKFSPSIRSGGNCKHLVASSGDLYVVDKYFSRDLYGLEEAFDFRVYSLDRQCGKWGEVRSLGNMAFFLTVHCSYSISMLKLRGHNGDCIYLAGRTNY
ncbi:hypothetical protein NL676_006302 [Syzygium grande]|nr:hypothetical protein NL676_006302 [Syzygium grande]